MQYQAKHTKGKKCKWNFLLDRTLLHILQKHCHVQQVYTNTLTERKYWGLWRMKVEDN